MTIKQDGDNVVFIAGCPRSGTTWLQRLIGSHPMVKTGMESFVIPWYVHPIASKWKEELQPTPDPNHLGLSAYLTESQGNALIKQITLTLLNSITADLPPNSIFLEKTPDNAFHIEEIIEYLPRARIIHIIRDGRDVVASILGAGKVWHNPQWKGWNAYSAAKYWVRSLDEVRRSKKFVPNDQFHELKYESLMASPEEVLDEAFRFIGVDWPKEQVVEAVRKNSLSADRGQRTKLEVRGEKALRLNSRQRAAAEFSSHSTGNGLNPMQKLLVWIAARQTLREYGYA